MKTKTENTEQRDWPSIEEQKQYWKNKEKGGYVETVTEIVTPYGKVVDEISTGDATNETRQSKRLAEAIREAIRNEDETIIREALSEYDASDLSQSDSTIVDPKPETNDLSRTEATCDWYDHGDEETPYRLRDEGRNPDGSGESYAERNL